MDKLYFKFVVRPFLSDAIFFLSVWSFVIIIVSIPTFIDYNFQFHFSLLRDILSLICLGIFFSIAFAFSRELEELESRLRDYEIGKMK